MLATDYIESRKSSARNKRAFEQTARARGPSHTSVYALKMPTHTHNKDIVLCYLNFKGAFPSADHDQLLKTLAFLGLPEDFINIITNLYNGAITEFVTPAATRPPSGSSAVPYKESLFFR
jgi:hypothetical protein